MPSKPPKRVPELYEVCCGPEGSVSEWKIHFADWQTSDVFCKWIKDHGWPLFQSYYELETQKKEVRE